ncbi:MAG: hypothetical protein ACLFTB_02350 [Desulfovibrionales bacterium]
MKRIILVVLFCMTVLVSCAQKNTRVTDQSDPFMGMMGEPSEFPKEAEITAVLDPSIMDSGEEVKQAIWNRGLEKGMNKILNGYITDGIIFNPFQSDQILLVNPLVQSTLSNEPYKDPITGDYRQDFVLRTQFIPAQRLAGEVTSLGEKKTIGAFDDEIFIEFYSDLAETPAYFLLAQKAPYEGENYYQVYGSGMLKQVINSKGLGMTLESKEEVEIGDLVFLLPVQGEALKMEQAQNAEAEAVDNDAPAEVVVEPANEPEPLVLEPKELK